MSAVDFYYWPTPNGWKVSIMLEECGIAYRSVFVNIGKGDQFAPAFQAISPNGRMPAIVDHAPAEAWGEGPVSVFESGAILLYLAEKTGQFLPPGPRGRKEALEWLFWQTGNQGPMAGQVSHFRNYAPDEERSGYARTRYVDEYHRNLGVLERRLTGREYILGDYSIADMIAWPWVLIAKAMDVPLDDYPEVTRWRAAVKARPAVQRGVDLGKDQRRNAPPTEEERRILFNRR
ncbi:MAG: glutathione S-transferase N-terminal domain-containing protein [Pseudomonadota bacterium]